MNAMTEPVEEASRRASHPLPRRWRRRVLQPAGGASGDQRHPRRRGVGGRRSGRLHRGRRTGAGRRRRRRHGGRDPLGTRLDARAAGGRRSRAGELGVALGPAHGRRGFRQPPPCGILRDFAEELKQRAERQDVPESAGVTLSSLHSAKGMEWQAVFLVGLVEGVVPHSSAKTDEELAESAAFYMSASPGPGPPTAELCTGAEHGRPGSSALALPASSPWTRPAPGPRRRWRRSHAPRAAPPPTAGCAARR